MTKWEYANIRTFRSWDKKAKKFSKWQVHHTGRKADVPLTDGLKEMGALGWELVTALPTSTIAATAGRDSNTQVEAHETVLLFKRAMEAEPTAAEPLGTAPDAAGEDEMPEEA
jgi:hypothetical protein